MGLSDLVQKAVYLGIGAAAYASEKAGNTLGELPHQLQKLADEFVDRGEMTAEEAKKFVDDMIQKAQETTSASPSPSQAPSQAPPEPRRIQIDDEDPAAETPTAETIAPQAPPTPTDSVAEMRRQVAELQEELRRLRKS